MATSTSVSASLSDIPATLKPYMTDAGGILPTAQTLLAQPYSKTYGDPLAAAGLAGSGRVAGLAPMQQQIGTELKGMQTPDQFTMGTGASALGLGALGSMLSPEQTQMYMSPYMQNVMDVNKQEALRDAQKNLVGQNLASARQGTYGGARSMLAESEANRNLQTKLGGIQATGMQNAYEAAQKHRLLKLLVTTNLVLH